MRHRWGGGKYFAVAAGLLAVVAYSTPAHAVAFDWTQTGGFVFGTATTGSIAGADGSNTNGGLEFNSPDGTVPNTYKKLGWGCEFGNALNCSVAPGGPVNTQIVTALDPTVNPDRSTLEVITFTSVQRGQLVSGGPAVDISEIIHRNQVIDGTSRTLGTVDITSLLSLFPNPGGPFPNLDTVSLGLIETLNQATLPECTETSNPLGSLCDDRFSILSPESFDPLAFTYLGVNYEVVFSLRAPCPTVFAQVGTVTVFDCDGTNDGLGDILGIDFTTLHVYARENLTSSIFVTMQLIEVVPAPTALILLGLGLTAAAAVDGIRGRSRKSS